MKSGFLAAVFVASVLSGASAFAAAQPIQDDVVLSNSKFSQKIYEALTRTTRPQNVVRVGGASQVIAIAGGISCARNTALVSGGARRVSFSCALLKTGRWSAMGMESYGSGPNRRLSLALYDALGIQETRELEFSSKTIEFNIPDGNGGTERNQITCIKPSLDGEKLGLRPTCQIINAL